MKLILTYILLCLIFQIDCFSQTDITKKSLENISFKEYHGEIADARNKEGLAFANISLLNSNISTISNINGDFSIKIPENYKPNIKVSFIGYSPKIVDLKNNAETLCYEAEKELRLFSDSMKEDKTNKVIISSEIFCSDIKTNPFFHLFFFFHLI